MFKRILNLSTVYHHYVICLSHFRPIYLFIRYSEAAQCNTHIKAEKKLNKMLSYRREIKLRGAL